MRRGERIVCRQESVASYHPAHVIENQAFTVGSPSTDVPLTLPVLNPTLSMDN